MRNVGSFSCLFFMFVLEVSRLMEGVWRGWLRWVEVGDVKDNGGTSGDKVDAKAR